MSTTDEDEGVDLSQLEENGFMALDECGEDDDDDMKVGDSRGVDSVKSVGEMAGLPICLEAIRNKKATGLMSQLTTFVQTKMFIT